MLLEICSFIKNCFHPNKLAEVFTPTTTAQLAYVTRDELEGKLEKYLHLSGKQIILYGHSGSGKTTLINNKLKQMKKSSIVTQCEAATTFNDILVNAFDEMDLYYRSESSKGVSVNRKANLSTEMISIEASLTTMHTEEHQDTYVRVLPPQLTPQRLAETLGKMNLVWIIEDFHKVAEVEKKRIADMIKIFIDKANAYPNLKIVCIGAVDTAREMVKLDSNLSTRVCELHVPLLTDDEIMSVIEQGCRCLNIEMTRPLKEKVKHYSNRLASLAHQMCFDICYSNEIRQSCKFKKTISDDKFRDAIEAYLDSNSDTFKSIYEASIKAPIGWYILKTFVVSSQSKLQPKQIRKRISNAKHRFSENDINLKLLEMSSGNDNILRYDANSGRYSISSPFWGAFLKMQIAIEEANRARDAENRYNQNLMLENQDENDALLLQILLRKYELKVLNAYE